MQHRCSVKVFRLAEGDGVHDLIRRRFIQVWGRLGQTRRSLQFIGMLVTRYGASSNSIIPSLYASEEKRRGNANVKYAWYGTSARKRYERLFHTVFVMAVKLKDKGHFGCGLSLS
ncbi:hypothetical protein K1719_037306 [Acacia pycnantha]|nr:hypothetical protein K1719_037306 [Acacia pycnantha]